MDDWKTAYSFPELEAVELEPLWRSILRVVIWVLIAAAILVLFFPAVTVAPIYAIFTAPWWVTVIFVANALIFWGIVLLGAS